MSVRLLVVLFCLLLGCLPLQEARTQPRAGKNQDNVKLVFVGDICLDTLVGEAVKRGVDPFAGFADVLAAADFSVGNLECVIAEGGEPVPKPWNLRAHPRVLPLLARHFDALSLANNHTGDFGPEAVVEELENLKKFKIPYFGGGRNIKEARQPLILERHGVRIALLGYNEFKPRSFEAGENRAGIAWSVDDYVVADIKAARQVSKADLVIPFMHWGWEYEPGPNERQQQLARLMIDAGADVVVGAHPHVTQGVEKYKDRLIVYSLGNFVFDGFESEEAKTG